MNNAFSRTQMLLGSDAIDKLKNAHVAVFGIGGVGSYTVEALARCGVGEISVIDNDVVDITNINRQLIATHKTVGMSKTEVAQSRISEINPDAVVHAYRCFYGADNADVFDFSKYSYIVDAIDTVSSKLLLIKNAYRANVPVISCMGAGNKLDPTRFEVSDIYNTSVCPLCRVMRKELKALGIDRLKVVYSTEPPLKPIIDDENVKNARKQPPGSVSFVPSVAGLIIAGEVVKDIIGILK